MTRAKREALTCYTHAHTLCRCLKVNASVRWGRRRRKRLCKRRRRRGSITAATTTTGADVLPPVVYVVVYVVERTRLRGHKAAVVFDDDDDDDDDDEQEEESASTLVRRAVMAARRREDDETQSLFSSYPAPTTVERQRRARERVTAALRKLKIERNLEKTPDVLGGYETKTRRRSHAVGDDSDARGRYATRRVSATEKEHFMSTPSSTPGSNRRSHSWNSISNNNAKKAGVSPLGPPRRVPADQSNSPNLISFSPAKVSSVKKTPLVVAGRRDAC